MVHANNRRAAPSCFIHHGGARSSVPKKNINRAAAGFRHPPSSSAFFDHDMQSTQLNLLLSSSDMSSQLPSGQVFEAQVNAPALGAFAVIFVVFGLLQLRTNQVNDAALRRKEALQVLRAIKSQELSGTFEEKPSPDAIRKAVDAYKSCIDEEERLRNVVPGVVRIVAPNGPASASEEEVQAAKQFLGIDLTEGGAVVPNMKRSDVSKEDSKMSGGAVAVLAVVGLTQIGLLFLLSFDPMSQSIDLQL